MIEPQEPQQVVVVDIRVPFWSMVFLMVKWALASIPALIILAVLAIMAAGMLGGLGRGVGR